jgi:four helix bundle protein
VYDDAGNDTTPEITDESSMACRLFRKAVQQGRSERRGESYSVPYVEPLSDVRTMLAAFVNSLLDAWKFTMELIKAVYQMTATFPAEERDGLSQQMRRAAVSIPSNIAEGAGRNGAKEFLNVSGISRGSLVELESQLQLAVMRGFAASDHAAFESADSIGKLLTGLHKKLSTT